MKSKWTYTVMRYQSLEEMRIEADKYGRAGWRIIKVIYDQGNYIIFYEAEL